ncbi:hypothetical protein BH11BAC2_BH11BAC2_05830 [soil metagenome]
MSEEHIYLFTGAVKSGKTSTLMKWMAGKSNLYGFLTPDQDGIRKFLDLRTGNISTMEVIEDFRSSDLLVGKFRFSNAIFQLGKEIIREAISTTSEYIIIDELGKLELDDKGFEPELNALIQWFKSERTSSRLIIVVRGSLLNKVLEKYQLKNVKIVTIDTFHEI